MDYTEVVSTKDQEVGPAKGSGPYVEIPFSNGSIGSTIGVPPKMQYQTNGSQEGYMSEDCLQNAEGTDFVLGTFFHQNSKSDSEAIPKVAAQTKAKTKLKGKPRKEKKLPKSRAKKAKGKAPAIMESIDPITCSTQASISSSDIRNRNLILKKEAELVIETGKLIGINYGGREKEAMEQIMHNNEDDINQSEEI
ncbi:hypothetical protein U1Q18_052576 [Sarracenia purpurea var. burkii]